MLIKKALKFISLFAWGIVGFNFSTLIIKPTSELLSFYNMQYYGIKVLGFIIFFVSFILISKFIKSWIGTILFLVAPLLLIFVGNKYVEYKKRHSPIIYAKPNKIVRHGGYYNSFFMTICPYEGYEMCLYDNDRTRKIIDQEEDPDDIRVWIIYTPNGECEDPNTAFIKDNPSIRLWANINDIDINLRVSSLEESVKRLKYEFRKVDSLQLFNYEGSHFMNSGDENKENLLYVYPVNDYTFCRISYKIIENVKGRKCMIYLRNSMVRNGSLLHLDYYDILDRNTKLKELLMKNKQLLRENLKYGSLLGK